MGKRLAAGLLAGLVVAGEAVAAPALSAEGLRTFLQAVVNGEPRSPRHYAQELDPLPHRSGKGSILPTLTVVAGKLGDNRCVYQFRIETWALGDAAADAVSSEPTGGRSTVKQAPCDALVQEVVAVAEYEVGALEGRVTRGAPRANNRERDAVVAAVRDALDERPPADAPAFVGQTLASRVNLRASPSLQAPVRATLAPSTTLELLATARADWYASRDGNGFVHRTALQSLRPLTQTVSAPVGKPAVTVVARVGTAHVLVRDQPSISGRVITRLSPGSEVRLQGDIAQGWVRLADESGYIPARALSGPPIDSATVAAHNMRVSLRR